MKKEVCGVLVMTGERLEVINLFPRDKNYKIIERYYEIIKELLTALMYLDGYKTLSHKKLIDYFVDNYKDNNYVNIYGEKNKNATNVASMVMYKVLTKLNCNKGNNYLNVSVNNDNVEGASVALMVMHQSHELGPNRLPGSIPGWGASTIIQTIINDEQDNRFSQLDLSVNNLINFECVSMSKVEGGIQND